MDFTVLQINHRVEEHESTSLMHYFIPFISYYYKQRFYSQSCVFPNKFRYLNNYPIMVGRGEENVKCKNFDIETTEIVKPKISFYYALEAMNFNLKHINVNNSAYYHYSNNFFCFDSMNCNVLGGPVVARELRGMISIVPTDLECRTVWAVIPVTYVPKVVIPFKIIFHILIIPGTVLGFIFLTQYLKGTIQIFEVFDAVQMFMGQSIRFTPRTVTNKITYVTIIILFVLITNDLYSDIVKINFDNEEVKVESLEDLDKSQMSIYICEEYRELYLFNLDDPLFKSLDDKIESKSHCLEELVRTRNHVCVDFDYDVKKLVENYLKSNSFAVLKRTFKSIVYQCDPMFVQFEPGSPYMKGIH